jgi:hypothetical protein
VPDHATKIEDEGKLVSDLHDDPAAEAARLHRLATADPEPERDGIMTSQQHEEKYGLERASDASVAHDMRGESQTDIETTSAPRASSKK